MTGPENLELPFFAYGIFQKGELGFLSIFDFVREVPKPTSVKGDLLIRDGLPILDADANSTVSGSLIYFKAARCREAYERINQAEPDRQYRWAEMSAGGVKCNCLIGKSPKKGSVPADEGWDGKNDPLFTAALDVVREVLEDNSVFEWDLKPMFRLQMAYLLLWSSIERYASLRYRLGGDPHRKVMQIAKDTEFGELLKRRVKRRHRVQRADRPQDHYELNADNARKSLEYYYQIRSNITHRGKGVDRDHETVRDSLEELFGVFKALLQVAFELSQSSGPSA